VPIVLAEKGVREKAQQLRQAMCKPVGWVLWRMGSIKINATAPYVKKGLTPNGMALKLRQLGPNRTSFRHASGRNP
jgi:hypothetical protein